MFFPFLKDTGSQRGLVVSYERFSSGGMVYKKCGLTVRGLYLEGLLKRGTQYTAYIINSISTPPPKDIWTLLYFRISVTDI